MKEGNKFVISKRIAGFGDLLISLCSAWQYAKRTNRTLVIDWRHSHHLKDKTRNAFPAFFEPVAEIDGVPVICDDSVSSLKFPTPTYFALKRRGKLNPFIVKYRYSRLLRKIPQVVAHRTSILNRVQSDEIELATHGGKDKLGDDCIVFICTDIGRILEALNESLDNVVTREKYLPPDNKGELLMDASSIAHNETHWGKDALVEMFLLARGDGLVCYPPESRFSFYARYCRNGPKLRETEALKI